MTGSGVTNRITGTTTPGNAIDFENTTGIFIFKNLAIDAADGHGVNVKGGSGQVRLNGGFIGNSAGDGVRTTGPMKVSTNGVAIFDNGGLGIDRGADGVTAADA